MNFSPYTRILLRYGLGYFVAKGLLPDELVSLLTTDPEFIEIVNLAAAAAVAGMIEGWYVLAKRLGWAT